MIRRTALAIERWMDDESMLLGLLKALVVFGTALTAPVLFIAWLCSAPDTAEATCLKRGGGWAIVGQHTALTPVAAGKTTMLLPRTVTDYGCVEVKR